jgi:fibronectin type 3 domain-containing protein
MLFLSRARRTQPRYAILFLLLCGFVQPFVTHAFVHPGGLHTLADLDRMKTNVLAGNHPWLDGWNALITDPQAQSNYSPHATADFNANRQNADADAHAAYLNTIRWYISGDVNFANTATNILNKWAATVTVNSETGGGLSGLPTMSFALAGELLRTYSGWQPADFASFTNMMVQYLYAPCNNYVSSQPCDFAHWTSWDGPNAAAILAIGVLCDDTNKFNQAVTLFQSGPGTAAISNAVPYLFGAIGQPEESGRDQEHCILGIADLGVLCQVAWNQGLDLYGYDNNRLLAGVEYLAQYNLNHEVPYTAMNNCANENLWFVSDSGRGRLDDRPVYEMFYNHYVVRQGLSAPSTKATAQLYRPERGSADHFGYGTLVYTLSAAASPHPATPYPVAPTGLTATPGLGQIRLGWTPPPGDLAYGYRVMRASTSGGPYTTITSWTANTTPAYTDASVVTGTTYYYVVAALNQTGPSAPSVEISAAAAAVSALPSGWTNQDVGVVTSAGSAQYTSAGNHTFNLVGAGTGIGSTGDGGFNYTYQRVTNNFTIIARLTKNSADKMGLMMRGSLATNAALVQFMMANNARQSIYGIRTSNGGNLNHYNSGAQFTYLPAWYKLVRNGNLFTAYQSDDGLNWITVQSTTISAIPASGYYVGLALNSGSATFDHVVYTNAAMTGTFASPAAPTGLTATAGASNCVALAWDAVPNAAAYQLQRGLASGGPFTSLTIAPLTGFYDTTTAANTTYYYVVSAIQGGGASTNSAPVSVTTPATAVPEAPADFTATASLTQVALRWSAVSGATTYNVKRASTPGGPYTNIATGVAAAYTDAEVSVGARYYYVLTAVNDSGESAPSPEVAVLIAPGLQTYLKCDETTGAVVALDATGHDWNGTLVNNPAFGTGYSNNAVNLSSNSSQYVTLPAGVVSTLTNCTLAVWVKQTTASPWARVFDFGTGSSSYMFLAPLPGGSSVPRFALRLNNGTEQQINGTMALPVGIWRHLAITLNGSVGILYVNGVAVGTNSALTLNPSSLGSTTQNFIGKSQFSDPYFNGMVDEFRIYDAALTAGEVATFTTALAAPANVSATATPDQIALKWNAVARAAGYDVWRSVTAGGPYAMVASPTTTNHTDLGLAADGTVYYYVVTARNTVGQSANSAQVTAALQLPPDRPTGLTASAGDAQVVLSWDAVVGATNYFVKQALVSGGSYTAIQTNGTSLAYTNTGLSNGTLYYYVVSAANAAGESVDSLEVSATPQVPAPAAPVSLSATAGDAQVALSWSAVSGATGYNVKSTTTNGGEFSLIVSNLAGLTYTNTGLANGTIYYYVVAALNAGGASPDSVSAAARPVSLTPPQLTLGGTGNQLQFTWPADHLGWSLQAQTNALGAGLGPNWTTILDSALTNQVFLPIDANSGSVFFRLILIQP